MEQLYHFIRLE